MDKAGIDVPGLAYTLIVGLGAILLEYFVTGDGHSIPWAGIAVATIPLVVKALTVNLGPEEETLPEIGASGSTRSLAMSGEGSVPLVVIPKRTKLQKFMRGG